MRARIEQLIRAQIRALQVYPVPNADGMVKLDMMENPYTLAGEDMHNWLADVAFNRYPDPEAQRLRARLRQVMQIPDGLELVLGNGSDELIQLICLAVTDPKSRATVNNTVLSFDPGFSMFRMIAEFTGMQYVGVPLLATDFSLDVEATLMAIRQHKPAVIFIVYPNNPTGNLFAVDALEAVIAAAPGLVVIDEAYQPFAQTSFLPRIADYEHVLLLRTVSKLGLAGLRLGYLIGLPEWLHELNKLRLPFNINALTQVCTERALQHSDELNKQAAMLREHREQLFQALNAFDSLEVYPSAANFILFRTAPGFADAIYQSLLKQKILIKNLSKASPLLHDCLRVSVGTADENKCFLQALQTALDGPSLRADNLNKLI